MFSVEGGVGGNYPLRVMDAHVHRQEAGALKCLKVEKKKPIAKLNTHIYQYLPGELPSATHKSWTLLCAAGSMA